ncbi:hypothetical protein CsSME_00045099 [Camellia sinensis var. sinensis]
MRCVAAPRNPPLPQRPPSSSQLQLPGSLSQLNIVDRLVEDEMRHRSANLQIDCRRSHRNLVPIAITSAMVAIALLGTVIGQLIFGYLGNRMGRRRVYGLALMYMVLSSIGCRFSICTSATCVLVSLGFFMIDDGSSDRLNPDFLIEPCDAKLWEARYLMSPFEDFDFVSTGNMIEEIFGRNTETSKLSDEEKH